MGDIADMMIDGTLDFYTGEYIGRGYGIPRTLEGSISFEEKRKRPLNGVLKWLDSKGVKCHEECHAVIRRYCEHQGHKLPGKRPMIKGGKIISDEFNKFTRWFLKNETPQP